MENGEWRIEHRKSKVEKSNIEKSSIEKSSIEKSSIEKFIERGLSSHLPL